MVLWLIVAHAEGSPVQWTSVQGPQPFLELRQVQGATGPAASGLEGEELQAGGETIGIGLPARWSSISEAQCFSPQGVGFPEPVGDLNSIKMYYINHPLPRVL